MKLYISFKVLLHFCSKVLLSNSLRIPAEFDNKTFNVIISYCQSGAIKIWRSWRKQRRIWPHPDIWKQQWPIRRRKLPQVLLCKVPPRGNWTPPKLPFGQQRDWWWSSSTPAGSWSSPCTCLLLTRAASSTPWQPQARQRGGGKRGEGSWENFSSVFLASLLLVFAPEKRFEKMWHWQLCERTGLGNIVSLRQVPRLTWASGLVKLT